MKELTISVAMATFNGERFLREQVESLARQTLLPDEIVVCDDGSADGTLDVLHRFAAEAPFPVRIYQNETRLGYRLNFLRAASLCSGSLIAFSDQDDVWLGQKLQRCRAVISETGSVLVIHSARVVDEKLMPLGRRTPSARRLTCLDSGTGRGWHTLAWRLGMSPGFACVFRSRLLSQVPPVPPLSGPGRGHEYWLFFAAEATGSVTLIPDALVLYRQHGRNTAGFRAHPERGLQPVLNAGGAEYTHQAETAALCAGLLADAAARSPELRLRLTRAQRWHEERAKSLALRASLYSSGPSFWAAAWRLFSLIFGSVYRPISQGGLGFQALAKDLVVPLLPRTLGAATLAAAPSPRRHRS